MTPALPKARDTGLYILEPNMHHGREHKATPYPLYAELYPKRRDWNRSDFNWNNSACFGEAFKTIQTRAQMGETFRSRQAHENTMFFHGTPLAAHSIYSVPGTLRLIDLKNGAAEIAARALARRSEGSSLGYRQHARGMKETM